MVCPLKELNTSALSGSPRRLTEGVLEVEGPTSADAGVASCLLFNAEHVFRRLRNDGKILEVGMIRGGGFEMKKRSVKVLLDQRGTSRCNKGNWKISVGTRQETLESRATASGKNYGRLCLALETKTSENFYATKLFAN